MAETGNPLAGKLEAAMRAVYAGDEDLIGHALKVWGHAIELMEGEPVDRDVVTAAAILHDIGIPEAKRRHGSADGPWQELEGPPVARAIMEQAGMARDKIDHACRIIANHHSARDIDTPEFRIIWDADWLVNTPWVHSGAGKDDMAKHITGVFRTKAGAAKARRMFL